MNSHVVSQKRKLICVASDMRASTSSQVQSGIPTTSPTRRRNLRPWIATNDARCRGVSLPCELSMRREGKPCTLGAEVIEVNSLYNYKLYAWQNEAKIINLFRDRVL